jgi:putative ABC transport system permease protein
VNIATYARRNLFRRRGRTIMTLVLIALVVLIFNVIRTIDNAWKVGAQEAAKDRLATRHKVSMTRQLPRRYIDDLRDPSKIQGIEAVTWLNWFWAKDPKKRTESFGGVAVDHLSWFDVMNEMKVDPAALEEWKQTPNGAIIGDLLARALKVKIGEEITITSDIYPGDWKFKIVGIYTATRKMADRNTLVFRWDFLNNDPRSVLSKDQVGWVLSRIDDPSKSAQITRAIDKLFDERDDQTITVSERAFQLSFLGFFSAILAAFDVVSLVILVIMLLVLANTLAMSVRERTHEYGVLRAIGFSPGHIFGFVLGEAMLLALAGGLSGVLLTMLLINGSLGPAIEDSAMGAMFPYVRTPMPILALSLAGALVIGVLSGLVPAIGASRRKVIDALRRID